VIGSVLATNTGTDKPGSIAPWPQGFPPLMARLLMLPHSRTSFGSKSSIRNRVDGALAGTVAMPADQRTSRTTPALRATPPWPRRGIRKSGDHREKRSRYSSTGGLL